MHFKQLLYRHPSDEFLSGEERCQVITTQRGQISSVPTTHKLLQKGIKVFKHLCRIHLTYYVSRQTHILYIDHLK